MLGYHSGQQDGRAHPEEAAGRAGVGVSPVDVVDERVQASTGLNVLRSVKYREISGPYDWTKRYKEVEADIAGGCHILWASQTWRGACNRRLGRHQLLIGVIAKAVSDIYTAAWEESIVS